MTDNGGGRGSGAADSWFKPTENRYRTQSEYQDPLEEENEDATVFPDSGGYAGLSSSRPPMVEPYPEALGGPPPAAPPSTPSISYPGASQAAFQPLTRVPGEYDDDNPSQDAGEREFPGVAASAQVPLPPDESGRTGDEVWGRDSWARPDSRAQAGSEGAEPAADDTPWGSAEPSGTTDFSWDAPEGAPANPATAEADAGAWNPGRPEEAGSAWNTAPGADEGAPWAALDAPLNDVRGADAPWSASGAPAAGESPWAAPDGAVPDVDAGSRGPDRSEDAETWTPSPSADDAPWGAAGPAESGADWSPQTAPDAGLDADAPWGAPAPVSDAAPEADAPWGGAASSGTSDVSWEAPVGADPSLDGPVGPDAGAWPPAQPADDAPWTPAAADDTPWGASAPVGDPTPGAGAPWGAPAETGGDWGPHPAPEEGLGADAPWGAPDGAVPDVDAGSRGPDRSEDAETWTPSPSADDAPWGGAVSSGTSDVSWEAPVGADPSLDGPVRPDEEAWTPAHPSDDAPWGAPAPAPDPGPDADVPWGGAASSGTSDVSWEAPVGADPSLDGPLAPDTGAWTPGEPAGDAPWDPPSRADDAPWGAAAPAESGTGWTPEADPGTGLGADPTLDGPVAPDASGWNQERPADDAPWGSPDGAMSTGAGQDDGSWNPGQPEDTDGWTPVPTAEDTPWGTAAVGPDAPEAGGWSPERPEGTEGWSPAPAAEDPFRGPSRDWDHDELGSRSWGDERRSDLRDEGTEGLESWAPAREGDDAWAPPADPEPWNGDRYADELSPEAPDPGPGASGNTWAFGRDDMRLPDVVREAEQRRREAAGGPEYQDWGGGPEAPADPLAAIADMQARAAEPGARGYDEPAARYDEGATQMFDAPAYDAPAYEAPGYDDPAYDAPGHDEPAHDGPHGGGATQMFDAYDEDDQGEYDAPVAQGAPSDVVPQELRDESEYDDGFTPADYGMPARPEPRKRRKDPIADDFPGFGDRPLGGEAGDAYPGYDSIDYLADTERGAVVTLWLGLASLLPGIGLITAVLALVVTGPRAKRAIRGSNGQLDGLGFITTGTVFAVVGILVTVASALVFFLL
ncbi:hypothetical protein [Nocardiopsis sp. YSL2]|uniref:hypothetical protein n=1 Tax=Nocardiopsis sp. YSL2 TaxID=2939492 RepID=UPI0026F45E76|nr:hypothetical protein [Nocardiopsis sp. YSL2]